MKKKDTQLGFTLIEMLVAVAVAALFASSIFLVRGNFDSTVRLNSITREVALLVRQAQTYGSGGGGDIAVGEPYGIYVDINEPNQIRLYSDNDDPADGYDSSDSTVEVFELPSPYSISDFCFDGSNPIDGPDYCDSAISPDDLSAYYIRPSLEANFFSQDDSGATSSIQAAIEITHQPSGVTERVIIDRTGYISTP